MNVTAFIITLLLGIAIICSMQEIKKQRMEIVQLSMDVQELEVKCETLGKLSTLLNYQVDVLTEATR